MAIQSLSRASIANANRKYNTALAGNPLYTDMELIATANLTGTAGLITFDLSNYSGAYKHLQVRATPRYDAATATANFYLRFNGDSANNYVSHRLFGNGSTVASDYQSAINAAVAGIATGASATTSIHGTSIIDILDISSSTKNKTIRSLSGAVASSSAVILASAFWLSTAAITSVTLLPNSGSFVANSRFSLYGIKG